MKRISHYIIALGGLLSCIACSEEKFTTFNGEVSGIYLQRDASYILDNNTNPLYYNYTDSTTFSFASSSSDVTESTMYVTVKTMGNLADFDRPFTIKVDENLSNAQRGVHYDYNESDCVIKANTAKTNLPITIYRHPDLQEQYLNVYFRLESNEYFSTELEAYKGNSNWQAVSDTLCGTRFKLIFSEIYTRPSYWDFADDSLGEWSASKEKKVNTLMGWTHASWEKGGMTGGVMAGHITYAAKLLRQSLQEAADAGTPVVDDDGEYMQLAPGYEVDYSAYE